jgi:hypothetical protein
MPSTSRISRDQGEIDLDEEKVVTNFHVSASQELHYVRSRATQSTDLESDGLGLAFTVHVLKDKLPTG